MSIPNSHRIWRPRFNGSAKLGVCVMISHVSYKLHFGTLQARAYTFVLAWLHMNKLHTERQRISPMRQGSFPHQETSEVGKLQGRKLKTAVTDRNSSRIGGTCWSILSHSVDGQASLDVPHRALHGE